MSAEARQAIGTIPALGERQLEVQFRNKGAVIMAFWLILMFGYVILGVAVFNIVTVGSGWAPLF